MEFDSINGNMFKINAQDKDSGDKQVKAACMDMCPSSERSFREENLLLDRFESIDGPDVERRLRKTSANMAVKVYSRSAAGAAYSSESIRPPEILQV